MGLPWGYGLWVGGVWEVEDGRGGMELRTLPQAQVILFLASWS